MSHFQFSVGELDCWTIGDGIHPLPARGLFANAAQDELEAALSRYGIQDETVPLPFHCVLVRSGQDLCLIDTGVGSGWSPTSGRLLESLKSAGFDPSQITTVLFSHGHADHTGGAVDVDGNVVFPQARHLICRSEFDFWFSEASDVAAQRATAARKKLLALQPWLAFFDQGDELLPGIRTRAAYGHTPHNLAIEIRSSGATALYVADALAHPIHLEHPDWHLNADLDPAGAVNTRKKLLNGAAANAWLVCAYHMSYPGVGRVVPQSDRWLQWLPLS